MTDPRQQALALRDPYLCEAIENTARIYDSRGQVSQPILLWQHAWRRCKSLKLTHWNEHPLIEGPMKHGPRLKRPPDAQLL